MNSKTPRTDALSAKVQNQNWGFRDMQILASQIELENKTLVDALVKAAGYLASVRTDRKLIRDGDEYALQTMDWANGALEYAESANTVLETYNAAESTN